jgi:hypothetical protein
MSLRDVPIRKASKTAAKGELDSIVLRTKLRWEATFRLDIASQVDQCEARFSSCSRTSSAGISISMMLQIVSLSMPRCP